MALGALAGVESVEGRAWSFDRKVIDGRFSSGGEVVVDERRRLVVTADRDAVNVDGIRPGVSLVDADRQRWVRTIPFWTQPWDVALTPSGTGAAGGEGVRTPQIAFGVDLDARRGLIVTSNSLTDTISIARVGARVTTAANRVAVGDHPFGVAIDEGRGVAYVAMNGDDRIDVVDLGLRRVVRSFGGVTGPTRLALDERTGTLYAGNADRLGDDHAITAFDAARGVVKARIPVDPNSRPTFDARTGRVYAASFATGRIAVIDAATGAVDRWIATGSTPHGVAVDPRHGLLYAPNLAQDTVTVIDERTLEVTATLPVAGVPLGVAVDERTGWAYVSSRDASTLTALWAR